MTHHCTILLLSALHHREYNRLFIQIISFYVSFSFQSFNKVYVNSTADTWEAAGSHNGWPHPAPTGQSTSGWCSGSCCCCELINSRTPAPLLRNAWSPHRPWCSPLLAEQNRRCRTSQTQRGRPGLCCYRSVGSPWSPPPERCLPWQW